MLHGTLGGGCCAHPGGSLLYDGGGRRVSEAWGVIRDLFAEASRERLEVARLRSPEPVPAGGWRVGFLRRSWTLRKHGEKRAVDFLVDCYGQC